MVEPAARRTALVFGGRVVTDRFEYLTGPGPKPERLKAVRPPEKRCKQCGGTGWIESAEERLPVMRCPCMTQESEED